MTKHRFNDMKEVDSFIADKMNPQPKVKPMPSLDVLKRRAALKGIRPRLPKLLK